MDKVIIPEQDYKYFVAKPDPSFSPQRNKAIIQETINKTDKFFAGIGKVINDNLAERIDMLTYYGTYRMNKGTKSFKEYVGGKAYSQLIGERILSKVRVMDSVNRMNGNNKYRRFILD